MKPQYLIIISILVVAGIIFRIFSLQAGYNEISKVQEENFANLVMEYGGAIKQDPRENTYYYLKIKNSISVRIKNHLHSGRAKNRKSLIYTARYKDTRIAGFEVVKSDGGTRLLIPDGYQSEEVHKAQAIYNKNQDLITRIVYQLPKMHFLFFNYEKQELKFTHDFYEVNSKIGKNSIKERLDRLNRDFIKLSMLASQRG